VAGIKTNAVRGDFTAREDLASLVADTGLLITADS
jgi:hypothetical protein